MGSRVLWDVTFCGLVNSYRRFGRAYRLHRQRLTLPELKTHQPATLLRPLHVLSKNPQLEADQVTVIAAVRRNKYRGADKSLVRPD